MSYRTTFLGTALALLAGCSSTEADTDPKNPPPEPQAICTAPELEAALADAGLAEAGPDNIVQMGECTIEGSFVVPAGVTLAGAGTLLSSIVGDESRPAIELAPGATLRDLGVVSKGIAGVIARGEGAGEVHVASVDIQANVGIGFGAESLAGVTLEDVTLKGPPSFVTLPANTLPTPDITGTHGVVLWTVAEASLRNVTSSSFAGFGALLINSKTTWSGGEAALNYGVGIMAIDGTTTLTDVKVSGTSPVQTSVPAYGVLLVSEALMTGTPDKTSTVSGTLQRVDASDNEGIGIMYAGGKGLLIEESIGDRNAFAGLVLAGSSDVRVLGSDFNETKELTLTLAGGAELTGGDGIQLMSAVHNITLEDVTLAGNARGGLLVHLGETELSQTTQTWSHVVVGGNPTFGALCQGLYGGQLSVWGTGEPQSAPWDEGIVRDDTQDAADAAFEIPLDVIGIIDPNDMPAPLNVVELGLRALTGQ